MNDATYPDHHEEMKKETQFVGEDPEFILDLMHY